MILLSVMETFFLIFVFKSTYLNIVSFDLALVLKYIVVQNAFLYIFYAFIQFTKGLLVRPKERSRLCLIIPYLFKFF